MQAESRAAYGASGAGFDDPGLKTLDDGSVVIIHAGRYGLPVDCAIVLDENAFVTNDGKSGVEHFPHGGLYPEEVIVPWIELTRVRPLPVVEGFVRGKARATFDGTVFLCLNNLSEDRMSVLRLTIRTGGDESHRLDLEAVVEAYSQAEIPAVLRGWPTHEQIQRSNASVRCRTDDGAEFEFEARLELEAEQMYIRDTTLEDLV